MADDTSAEPAGRHRPKTTTVFVAAFVAGAVAAVVVNRALDLHLAQSKPQVESEPIFVALRPMPQGAPVTVWDVALRDWPRAMLPASALRAGDSFEGSVLKYPVREGQPLLAVQLMPAEPPSYSPPVVEEAFVPPPPAAAPSALAQQEWPQDTVAAQPAEQEDSAIVPIEATALDDADTEAEPPLPSTRKRFELEPEAVSTESTVDAEPVADSPTPAVPEPQPTRVASDVEPLLDMPSRPAVDLEKIPSVMARSETPAELVETNVSSVPVRYLVVPERIARQADTSFVPPPAVEPTPEPAPAPAQPANPSPTRTTQTRTPPVKGFPQRPGQTTTAARPTQQQQRPKKQMQPQKQTQPQSQEQKQVQRQQQPPQQTSQTSDRSRDETASKPREPMFPVLAAGIEAMGNRWRGEGEEAVATDQPAGQQRK